jgi:cytochrome c oxidase subunit IV
MSAAARNAPYYRTAAALGVLLVLTIVAAALPLGRAAPVVALLIAGLKAALVALIFMRLRWSSGVQRLFAGAGLFWVAVMLSFTLADYLTRDTGSP